MKDSKLPEDAVAGSSNQLSLWRRIALIAAIVVPLVSLTAIIIWRPDLLGIKEKEAPSGNTSLERELDEREDITKQPGYKPVYSDYLIMGDLYMAKGQYQTAEDRLREAEKLAPNDMDVLHAFTKLYRLQHRKAKALEYYQKLINAALEPGNPRRGDVKQYRDEEAAVKNGDFELKTLIKEESGGMPL